MTPMNIVLIIGAIAFLISCILNSFPFTKKLIIYPPSISIATGLILIPFGFRIDLGSLV